MDPVIEEALKVLVEKYKLPKAEIYKMVSSEFRVARNNMSVREIKEVKWIYLGKVHPSNWFRYNHGKFKRHLGWVEKLDNGESGTIGGSTEESSDMLTVPPKQE